MNLQYSLSMKGGFGASGRLLSLVTRRSPRIAQARVRLTTGPRTERELFALDTPFNEFAVFGFMLYPNVMLVQFVQYG